MNSTQIIRFIGHHRAGRLCLTRLPMTLRLMSTNHDSVSNSEVSKTENPYANVNPAYERIRPERTRRKWIDSLRVLCKGGHGGNGLPKYRGIGGKGGDCIIEATSDNKQVPNLYHVFKTIFKGESKNQKILARPGNPASKHCIYGAPGEDAVLKVPIGITISNDEGRVLYSLDEAGKRVLVAEGGPGGGPDNNWMGQQGQKHHIRLDLKLIADIGLVGFPNAGKSTFLKAISRAKPKIASYPFTTIQPNLGHVIYPDERQIMIADLPGLIEGAHYNVGMGHRFLKHVERTKMLLFVVDANGFQLNPTSPFRSAFETVVLLNRELELYRSELVQKPAILLINKMDVKGAKEKLEEFENQFLKNYDEFVDSFSEEWRPETRIHFDDIIPISAKKSQTTVNCVKERLREWIDVNADKESKTTGMVIKGDEIEKEIVKANTPTSNKLLF